MNALEREKAETLCDLFELNQQNRHILVDQKLKAEDSLRWVASSSRHKNSDFYREFRRYETEILLYMMASATRDSIKRAISTYITKLRLVKTLLTGNDLKEMGYKPGPIFREILSGLRDARLNDEVKTRQDEEAFVLMNWAL